MLQLIVIPIIAAVAAQALKLIIDGIPNNLRWQHLVSDYGGMPSSHAAFVTSLATMVGITQGFNSAAFAISFVLMVVVIRDAVGFRREIGRNAVFTNMIARKAALKFPTDKGEKIQFLNEQVGHYFSEVWAGLVIGGGLSVLLYSLFALI